MSDQTKLLPCPFCGTDDDIDPTGVLNGDGTRSPECMGCGATAPTVATWNCRIAAPAEDVRAVGDEPVAYELLFNGEQVDVVGKHGFPPESLEVYDRNGYTSGRLYRHPQRPVVAEPETLFQKGQRLAKEGHGLSNLWGNCAKDSDMDEVLRGMEAYWQSQRPVVLPEPVSEAEDEEDKT